MPGRGRSGSLTDGLTVAPSQSPFPGLVAGVLPTRGNANAEVKEALSHCAKCGSGLFREFRQDEGTGES